jgi:hypothetical protein
MITRESETRGPQSQERYMSSREFAELRGVSGVAVSTRAALLVEKQKQNFIWWLQGMSLAEGGFKRLARELLEMFPERIGTKTLHQIGCRRDKIYGGEIVKDVQRELERRSIYHDDLPAPRPGADLMQLCRDLALNSRRQYGGPKTVQNLEEFLVDLCINPKIHFSLPGETTDFSSIESANAIEEFPELDKYEFKSANLPYFYDIIGALLEFKASREAKIREGFQLTAIGGKIWETLNYALASNSMVVLDGLEGRGKSEAVKAWCDLHLGSCRFVTLKGITNKTTAFREIAKSLGIASSYTRTAPEMQARIEDVLKRSRLMLLVDEAHFVFNQSRRMYSRPELVDWIDTAICNHGVPIALITTPQFLVCMTRASDQVEWNYRQFRRRVKRWVKLPDRNTEADLTAVARSIFKGASAAIIKEIVGYAMLSKRDLSAVGDVAGEVRAMLGSENLSLATLKQVHCAIYDYLLPSDKTFLEGMAAARQKAGKSGRKPHLALPAKQPEHEPLPDGNFPTHRRGNLSVPASTARAGVGSELIKD